MDKLDLILNNQLVIMDALKLFVSYETGKLISRNEIEKTKLLTENINSNLKLIKRIGECQQLTTESIK